MEAVAINETEMFSNPIAPMEEELPPLQEAPVEAPPTISRLTNADFRKLLMTPRVSASKAVPAATGTVPSATTTTAVPTSTSGEGATISMEGASAADDAAKRAEAAERRRKRKMYYAKLKRHDRDGEEDLSAKYRDRAKERRDGKTDYQEPELLGTTADYRAVAPTAAAGQTYAERRRQAIQESKYLGGDMQHTHLVKGLDYALLEKMRTEIHQKEREEDELDELEEALEEKTKEKSENVKEEDEAKMNMKTTSARNIYRVLFRNRLPDRNELFQAGRMAYRFELEEDFAEFDVPTTVIRSKAELPQIDGRASLTTNEIVIQKLTQIFSYLRAGRRQLKRAKLKGKTGAIGGKDEEGVQHEREKPVPERSNNSGIAIYDGIDDYVAPGVGKRETKDRRGGEKRDRERERERDRDRDRKDRDRDRDRERDRRTNDYRDHRDNRRREEPRPSGRDRGRDAEARRSYFDKVETEEEVLRPSRNESAREFVKEVNQRFGHYAVDDDEIVGDSDKHVEKARLERIRAKTRVAGYDECYPGLVESYDAMGDSDDEADYTKMDMGNKKGPVGRWDFESQEDYSRYMSSKEALPKAAFQYGVKMQDGRRTRRAGPKDEKAELNRQWQQIQSMMNKRKEMGDSGGPESKSRRY